MTVAKFKVQTANCKVSIKVLSYLLSTLHFALCTCTASAQTPPLVTDVRVEQEDQLVTDPNLTGLIETKVGQPLTIRQVRETIAHLDGVNRFDDVVVYQEPTPTGVRLRYLLFPLHPIDRIEFRGTTGLSVGELRRTVTERFGVAPRTSRVLDVIQLLRETYERRGFRDAQVTYAIEETHHPDRATLVMQVEAGARAFIRQVNVLQSDPAEKDTILGVPDIEVGQPYDGDAIDRELTKYVDRTRARGYYEARASHSVTFEKEGAVVVLSIARGPLVTG